MVSLYSILERNCFVKVKRSSRSPDGQCFMLSSRDGYCTLVIFDEPIPLHTTQQQGLQLQSIAHSHGAPVVLSRGPSGAAAALPFPTPAPTPTAVTLSLPAISTPTPVTMKRPLSPAPTEAAAIVTAPASGFGGMMLGVNDQLLTPSSSADPPLGSTEGNGAIVGTGKEKKEEHVKKKRRVELTKVADLES